MASKKEQIAKGKSCCSKEKHALNSLTVRKAAEKLTPGTELAKSGTFQGWMTISPADVSGPGVLPVTSPG